MRGGQTQRLEQETGQSQKQQHAQDDGVVGEIASEPRQFLAVPAVNGHEQADQVDDELVGNVERALVKAQTKVRTHDVGFEEDDQRPDEQDDKTPEDEQVHQARVDVPGPDQASVQERDSQDMPRALADTVDWSVGPAATPDEVAACAAI